MTEDTLPKTIIFNDGEKVLAIAEHSKVGFYASLVLALAGALLFTFIIWLASGEGRTISWTSLLEGSLFVAAIPALAWLRYKKSVFVVTSQRIIDHVSIVVKTITRELPLAKVESIDLEISNLGDRLNYGTVLVRGTGGKTLGQSLTYPKKIKDIIASAVKNSGGQS